MYIVALKLQNPKNCLIFVAVVFILMILLKVSVSSVDLDIAIYITNCQKNYVYLFKCNAGVNSSVSSHSSVPLRFTDETDLINSQD